MSQFSSVLFGSHVKTQAGVIPGRRFLPGTVQAVHVLFAAIIPFFSSLLEPCTETLVWLTSAQRAIELFIFLLLNSKGERSSISDSAPVKAPSLTF